MVLVIVVRSPTAVEVVGVRDRNKDNRVLVARPVAVFKGKEDLVPMVVISVASRVTVERNVFFVSIRDHRCHPGAHIARTGLQSSRANRDRLITISLVSSLLHPNSRTSISTARRRLDIRVIYRGIRNHPRVRVLIKL